MTARLLIQGSGAAQAAAELAGEPDFAVECREPEPEGTQKEVVTLAVIATIVGIASATLSAADLIIKWRDRWRDRNRAEPERPIQRIVIEINDRRHPIDRLTTEQLALLLDEAEIPPRP